MSASAVIRVTSDFFSQVWRIFNKHFGRSFRLHVQQGVMSKIITIFFYFFKNKFITKKKMDLIIIMHGFSKNRLEPSVFHQFPPTNEEVFTSVDFFFKKNIFSNVSLYKYWWWSIFNENLMKGPWCFETFFFRFWVMMMLEF